MGPPRERTRVAPNRMAFGSGSVTRTDRPTDRRLFACCRTENSVRLSVGLPRLPTLDGVGRVARHFVEGGGLDAAWTVHGGRHRDDAGRLRPAKGAPHYAIHNVMADPWSTRVSPVAGIDGARGCHGSHDHSACRVRRVSSPLHRPGACLAPFHQNGQHRNGSLAIGMDSLDQAGGTYLHSRPFWLLAQLAVGLVTRGGPMGVVHFRDDAHEQMLY